MLCDVEDGEIKDYVFWVLGLVRALCQDGQFLLSAVEYPRDS